MYLDVIDLENRFIRFLKHNDNIAKDMKAELPQSNNPVTDSIIKMRYNTKNNVKELFPTFSCSLYGLISQSDTFIKLVVLFLPDPISLEILSEVEDHMEFLHNFPKISNKIQVGFCYFLSEEFSNNNIQINKDYTIQHLFDMVETLL
jgi:hypothetical protein